MPIAPQGLALLVCPTTRAPLRPADAALLSAVNALVDSGALRDHGGDPVAERLTEALVTEDGAYLYRHDDGVTDLLAEHRIDLAGVGLGAAQAEPAPHTEPSP